MCLIFGDDFWRQEWMREATEEVHNGLTIPNILGSFMCERMAVANLALQSLAGIDDNLRESLEQIKQEDASTLEIAMRTAEKSFKELSARRNSIAKSLWVAKTKSCIAQTFIDEKI
jgi:hypothetical protein